MGVDRYGVDRTGLQPPGNEPTMVQAGLALAGVLAAVLLVAVSLLSTTATVNAAIQRGIGWLKTNQRAEGYWWTQSLRNSFDTSNFLTHAGTTFALKALAVTELETGGVADAEH